MNNSFNSLNPLTNSAPKSKKNTHSYGFIEALKDQAKTATGQTPQSEIPQRPFNFAEYMRLRERQLHQHEQIITQRQQSAETLVYHRKEEAAKKEIEIIKQEIKTLVVQTGSLSSELVEAEKTVSGRIPDIKTGSYYLSFFDRLRNLIRLAKKRIIESRTWLQVFTARAKAKSYYWGQFKKSGTKFLLSQERYMSTQAG